jgi:hypothetical protein
LPNAGIKLAIGSAGTPGNPYLDPFFALVQPTRPSEALSIEKQ